MSLLRNSDPSLNASPLSIEQYAVVELLAISHAKRIQFREHSARQEVLQKSTRIFYNNHQGHSCDVIARQSPLAGPILCNGSTASQGQLVQFIVAISSHLRHELAPHMQLPFPILHPPISHGTSHVLNIVMRRVSYGDYDDEN